MSNFETAIHEAGHVLAFHSEGRQVNSVSLDPPATRYKRYDVNSWSDTVSHLFCIMAGNAAEYKLQGKSLDELAYGHTDAFSTLGVLDKWSIIDRKLLVEQALQKTDKWLDKNFDRVQFLAKKLYKHSELTSEDLEIYLG